MVASIAMVGCSDEPNRDPDPGAGAGAYAPSETARELCVDTINQYRATVGSPPLTEWVDIEGCVDNQARQDGQANSPHSAFGQCGENAQDECPGWPAPPENMIQDCLAMMWAEGPGGGHYENMRNPNSTLAACGYWTDPDNPGSLWATQDFR
jgi:hypothetical protein